MEFGRIKHSRKSIRAKLYNKAGGVRYSGYRTRRLGVRILLARTSAGGGQYRAQACISSGPNVKRCAWADGKSPTAVVRKSMIKLARSLK